MARFSDRLGITKPPTLVQVDSMDERLRNRLWNVIARLLGADPNGLAWRWTAGNVGEKYFGWPLDSVPAGTPDSARQWLRTQYFKLARGPAASAWWQTYNLLEAILQAGFAYFEGDQDRCKAAVDGLNTLLEEERSAYRWIDGEVVPIADTSEVQAVEGAIANAGGAGLDGARAHLHKALEHFSRRPTPDYHNAIKEAISAVESTVRCMDGLSKAELDDALDALTKRTPIHAALASACKKLYGYTSDERGIRHALGLDEAEHVGFDEAKLMIVTCSAFVSFLIAKAEKAKLLKPP